MEEINEEYLKPLLEIDGVKVCEKCYKENEVFVRINKQWICFKCLEKMKGEKK